MNIAPCADAALLAGLHAAGVDPPWTAGELAELLVGPGVTALIATQDGGPSAFILCRQAAEEAEVLTLTTLPRHRRQGLATALVRAAGAMLADAGAGALFLEVAKDNAAARALYEREGFREVGRRRAYYPRGGASVDALVLRRDLNRLAAEPYA